MLNKKQVNMIFNCERDYENLIADFNAECADEEKRKNFRDALNMMIVNMINGSKEK